MSVLKINVQKSEMIHVGAGGGGLDRLTSLLSCKVRSLPTSCLGSPLGVHNSYTVWDSIRRDSTKIGLR